MVYVSDTGEIVCDHLSPKQVFDSLRLLCKGNNARTRSFAVTLTKIPKMAVTCGLIRGCLNTPSTPLWI